jgi:hypothetical protein
MSISVQCPNCLYLSRVAEGMAGRRVRCPDCDRPFEVIALDRATSNPPPALSLAFLDEDDDVMIEKEPRLAPLVPRSLPASPAIGLARRSVAACIAPSPPSSIYVGLGIGIAFALSLSVAFAVFLR